MDGGVLQCVRRCRAWVVVVFGVQQTAEAVLSVRQGREGVDVVQEMAWGRGG